MVTKLGQFKKLKCPNFVNCPYFVTISCRVLKMKIFFFDIPSYPGTLLFSSVLHFFVVENIQNCQLFWKNLLVNEFWTAMDGG